jgi:S-adenosylmethionine decarboxylase
MFSVFGAREMANEIDGLHLIVDGLVESPAKVFSEDNLRKLLLQLVSDLKMQLIFGPLFHNVEIDESRLTGDVFQDEGGISGFCMIGTSHISIHVWPLRQHFSMDVFSCKQFDAQLATKTITEFLGPQHMTCTQVQRRQGGLVDEISRPIPVNRGELWQSRLAP